MKLFGSAKTLIDKIKNGKNVPSLEMVQVVLVHYNLVDNQYQQKPEVLYNFTPNKSYAYLLSVGTSNLVFFKNCFAQSLIKLSSYLLIKLVDR